jgi:replication factor C subunit 1
MPKMPADIRNFFGGKTSTPIREKDTKKEEDSKKKRNSKIDFNRPQR